MATTDGFKFDPTPLKQAFLAWGHGYKKLAELVGCSTCTAHLFINGRVPRSKSGPNICGILGVKLSDCWKQEDAA